MEGPIISFIKLSSEEVDSRLFQLVQLNNSIDLWERDSELFKVNPLSNENGILKIFSSGDISTKINKEYFATFKISKNRYYSKLELITNENEDIICSFKSDIYKFEKRVAERLLTFPHFNAYLFTERTPSVKSNVVDFKRPNDSQLNAINSFEEDQSAIKREDKNEFRVLDLSVDGVSFLVSDIESKNFRRGSELENIEIGIDDKFFPIKKIKIITLEEFSDSRASHLSMFRVGAKFIIRNLDLENVVIKSIDSDIEKIIIDDEFLEFINENN
jgi:hypothetical protein